MRTGPLTPAERRRIIRAAEEWLRTPYRPTARLKGVGVDCAQFLIAVFHEAGILPLIDPGHYSPTLHLHRPEDLPADRREEQGRYLRTVLEYAHPIMENEAQEGDVVLYKVAHGWAHGAIIVRWPELIIHAVDPSRSVVSGVQYSHGTREGFVRRRERRFYSIR